MRLKLTLVTNIIRKSIKNEAFRERQNAANQIITVVPTPT